MSWAHSFRGSRAPRTRAQRLTRARCCCCCCCVRACHRNWERPFPCPLLPTESNQTTVLADYCSNKVTSITTWHGTSPPDAENNRKRAAADVSEPSGRGRGHGARAHCRPPALRGNQTPTRRPRGAPTHRLAGGENLNPCSLRADKRAGALRTSRRARLASGG